MAEGPADDENFEYQLAAVAARSGTEPAACQKRAARLIACTERAIMNGIWAHVRKTTRPAAGPMTHTFCVDMLSPLANSERSIVGAYIVKETQPALPYPLPGFTWSISAAFVEDHLHGFFRVTASEAPIAPDEQKS